MGKKVVTATLQIEVDDVLPVANDVLLKTVRDALDVVLDAGLFDMGSGVKQEMPAPFIEASFSPRIVHCELQLDAYKTGDVIVCPECEREITLLHENTMLNKENPPTIEEYCAEFYGHLIEEGTAPPPEPKRRVTKNN